MMPVLYLTPASISYLTLTLLALIITVYLVARFARHRKQLSHNNVYLLATFFSITLLSLLLCLEYSLTPSERLIPFNLENTAVAILMAALIHFAYIFPAPIEKQKVERRIVSFLTGVYLLVEAVSAVHIFNELGKGHVASRLDQLQYVMIAEFIWVVFVFARGAILNRQNHAARNFAAILVIPLTIAVLTNFLTINSVITILYPILSSIGLLFTVFLFAINFLSTQPERLSFIHKISGFVLTSVLAVLGVIPWLITAPYAAHYTSPLMSLDHRTIRFSPNGSGGYMVNEIPFQWEADLGEWISWPAFNPIVGYDFDFPFFGQPYHQIYVTNSGTIGIGESFIQFDQQIHFTTTPIISPLMAYIVHNGPGSGGFVRIEPGKAVITWNKMAGYFEGKLDPKAYTFQVVLFADGTFDVTYNGLPDIQFSVDSRPDITPWMIGIKPVVAPTAAADFTRLPMEIGPAGAIQDEYLLFRAYLHAFLWPVAAAILISSLFFLVGTMYLLNYGLARPLRNLLKGVQSFNAGQRETSFPIQSNDEIGFLTESFNNLGDELNRLILGLEHRVVERTQELAHANRQLRSEIEARTLAQAQVVEQQRAVAALEERERVARELHDGVGQVLGFINVQAQSANDSVLAGDRDTASHLITRVVEVAQEAHDDVRGYILGLKKESPAAPAQGLIAALEEYCQHLERSFGFQTTLCLPEDLPSPLAAREVENQMLFVIREALSNARAHSGQKQAEVSLAVVDGYLRAVIEDRGLGFRARKKDGHFGLEIMRERAEQAGGSLEVVSSPGSGTRVTVSLPRQTAPGALPGKRVLLVDDHPLFLEGLANLIAGRGMRVVGAARDGQEALEKARLLRPDAILMDIEMPGCDGLEATRRIKAEMPEVKVVMLTVSGEEQHLFDALQSGASGYLLKSLDAAELTTLFEELLRGEVSVSPQLANKMLEAFTRHKAPPAQAPGVHQEPLTPRQMEILRLVTEGKKYKEIAAQLNLAEVTVKYHMAEILGRLHLNSRSEAVQYFRENAGR